MTSAGLTCRELGFSHQSRGSPQNPVLSSINVHFAAGEVAWISGPTGAGKSTLLHLLAGLRRPSEGEILADGQPVSRWLAAHRDRWRRRLGIIFQQGHLVADLSVLENVMLPLIPRSTGLGALRNRALETLRAVDLEDGATRPPAELSGGERQRAAAARALIAAPRFLLADEPFAHQDDAHARALLALLRARAREGTTVVIAAHAGNRSMHDADDRHWQLADCSLKEMACPFTPC